MVTAAQNPAALAFSQNQRLNLRRSAFQLLTKRLSISSEDGRLSFHVIWAPHKIDDEIHVYSDEQGLNEVLAIKSGYGWNFSFDVMDPKSDQQIGAIMRRDFKSYVSDEWKILSGLDSAEPLGVIRETSLGHAFLSRMLGWLFPQSYEIVDANNQVAATFKRRVNPFFMNGDLALTSQASLDSRLVLAAGILLSLVERRQR